uniref:FlgD immunoglobulin-like domain containing protein n=1 Tax=Fodinibius sp. TaxID=1872440 RepID=UPI003566362E
DHMPLLGQKNFRLEWDIVTDLIPYSGYGLKQDSLLLYYSVDSGAYQVLPLEQVAGSTWEATIPFQEPGSEIAYYLHAVDFSGKVMEHPYIGQPDPHRFVVKYATDVVVDPDTLVFTTPEEMILGKSFNIMNFTNGDLDLTYLETESSGAGFAWYAEPAPGMPLTMEYGDTLSMTVFIEMPVDGPVGDFVTDTMDIISEYGAHQVIIKVDPDLLSGLSEMASAKDLIVMPNPMADRTKIEFNMVSGGRATLLVSDMEGKAVRVLHEGMLSSGQHTFYWDGHTGGGAAAVPGAYLIELRTAAKRLTGKVIKSR